MGSPQDQTSILNFRHLFERHELTGQLLTEIIAHLCEWRLIVGRGTTVSATNINAPSSTKNAENNRDAEMHMTCKEVHTYNPKFCPINQGQPTPECAEPETNP